MTSHNRWIALALVAMVALFVAVPFGAGRAAEGASGLGPGDALPLPDGWQTVAPGQRTWYAFRYAGDRSEVTVDLSAGPAGSAAFAVWSPTDVERWAHGGAESPSGRGSANAYRGGDLVWAGSSSLPGTYYVAVEPSGSAQTWYNLSVSGSGVSRELVSSALAKQPAPAPTSASRPVATLPAPSPASAIAAVIATPALAMPGYHPYTPTPTRPAQYPDVAVPLPDGPQTLAPGQRTWYAFTYAGDRSRILMHMHADPPGSATFTVWSWDVLQRWGEGYFNTPTGRGTPNDVYGGDPVWHGGSIIRGKWYVVVEQSGASPSTYTLEVSGIGVDRTLPPTPVPTPTYSLPIPTPGIYG